MITESDVRALRFAHSVLTRRGIDYSRADVRMMHGVLHIKGVLAKAVGAQYPNLKEEVEHAMKVIKSKPEVRELCLDVTYMDR
ncbi:MAG TPA: hypothetical protein VGE01_10410 [Fimbriimonas sp.]